MCLIALQNNAIGYTWFGGLEISCGYAQKSEYVQVYGIRFRLKVQQVRNFWLLLIRFHCQIMGLMGLMPVEMIEKARRRPDT